MDSTEFKIFKWFIASLIALSVLRILVQFIRFLKNFI